MANQIYYVGEKRYNLPQDQVAGFLQLHGDKAIPLDKMPKTRYQIPSGQIIALPYGEDEQKFLSYPGYENAIKITDNSNPPINGFTTPNPAQFPNAALDGTSDDNVNAPMYDQLKLQQEELLNTSPIKVPYSVFDPEGKDYDETTARRVERAVGGMYDPMTQHWASLDPQTGMLLKGINHPSIQETLDREAELGNEIIKKEDGRYYSVPKTNKSWDSSIHGVDSTKEDRARNWTKKYGISPEELGELLSGYEDGGGPEKFGTFDEYLDLAFGTKDPEEGEEISAGEQHKQSLLKHLETLDLSNEGEIKKSDTKEGKKLSKSYLDPRNIILLRELGYSHDQIEKHGEQLLKEWASEQGYATQPSGEELAMALATGGIAASVVAGGLPAVISAGAGLALFEGMSEVESAVSSLLQDKEYEPFNREKIANALPDDVSRTTRKFVDFMAFIAKGVGVGKLHPKLKPFAEKFTKQIITKYKMPEKVYLSPEKVQDIWKTGKKITKEEANLFNELGLTGKKLKKALKEGVEIEVPMEKVIMLADRPIFGKLKEIIGLKPTNKIIKKTSVGQPSPNIGKVSKEQQIELTGPIKKSTKVKTTQKPTLDNKKGYEFIESKLEEGYKPLQIKKMLMDDPHYKNLDKKELKLVDAINKAYKKGGKKEVDKVLNKDRVEVEEIKEFKIRKLKNTDLPLPKPEKIKDVPIIESDIAIVDGKGNPVIARYDDKAKIIETNPVQFNKLSKKEQLKVIEHEKGHATFDALSDKEKALVKKQWDALPKEQKEAFNKQFPTQEGYEHTEFYAQMVASGGKLSLKGTKSGSTKGKFKLKEKPKNEVKLTEIEGTAIKKIPKVQIPKKPGFTIDKKGKMTIEDKSKALESVGKMIAVNLNKKQTPKVMADGRALNRIEKKINNLPIRGKSPETLQTQIADRALRES